MFRVSRRLDYGLQLMTSLASDPENHSQPTAALATKLDMPLPFLHQIAHVLMQAGLIKATPGQKGGLQVEPTAAGYLRAADHRSPGRTDHPQPLPGM